MEIECEKHDSFCFVKCPSGKKPMVGSRNCTLCNYYVGDFLKNGKLIVECCHPDSK